MLDWIDCDWSSLFLSLFCRYMYVFNFALLQRYFFPQRFAFDAAMNCVMSPLSVGEFEDVTAAGGGLLFFVYEVCLCVSPPLSLQFAVSLRCVGVLFFFFLWLAMTD